MTESNPTPLTTRKPRVSSKVTYPALDGLRALAITLVFIDHFGGGSHGGLFLELFNKVRVFGPAGVSLFFVLSGFLITGILYDTRLGQHYFKNFYIRRSLRIFPIFYLVLALCVALTPILHFQLQWGHVSFLFYLGNFFADKNWSLYNLTSSTHPALSISLAHFWSLFVEEQFYLIWPVVIFLVRDRVKLIRLSVAVILLVLLLRIGLVWFLPFAKAEQFALRMLPTRADDLLVGAAMALLLRGPTAERWLRRSWGFFLSGSAAFFLLALWRGNFGFYEPYNMTIGLTFISLASAGLIAMAIQDGSNVFRLLSLRPLRIIGKYSYGFYIYHDLFIGVRIAYLAWCMAIFHSMLIGGLVYASSSYLITLLVAGLSYELYEKRFLAMKSRFQYEGRDATFREVPGNASGSTVHHASQNS
jgi:peptidoglycan/LPS O-acetylase OafA/YrhL